MPSQDSAKITSDFADTVLPRPSRFHEELDLNLKPPQWMTSWPDKSQDIKRPKTSWIHRLVSPKLPQTVSAGGKVSSPLDGRPKTSAVSSACFAALRDQDVKFQASDIGEPKMSQHRTLSSLGK
ncbi:hypothetical protein AB5N19_01939 [Seiridium cardinale]